MSIWFRSFFRGSFSPVQSEPASGRDFSERRSTWPLALLILLAMGLRVAWVLHLPTDSGYLSHLPDQNEYLELGHNLRDGRGLNFIDPRFNDTVYAYRTPGYPFFIAALGANVKLIRIVQAIIDSLNVLAVYWLAGRWLTVGRSLFCAALLAFNPFLIYFSGLILSETVFTAMLIWGMAMLLNRIKHPKGSSTAWFAGAILLVLSILVRPSALLLPVILGVIAAFVDRGIPRPCDWPGLPPVTTLMLVLTLFVLLPWAWRNQRVLKSWIWTTTNSGMTLYDGFNPDATGASDQTFVRSMPQLRAMDEVARSEYLADQARQYVRQQPGRSLQLTAIKIARTLSPLPLSAEYGTDWRLIGVSLLYMLPLDILAIAGLWTGGIPRSAKVFLLAPLLYFTIVHAASVGSLRYRIPADVPIAILAGMGTAAFGRMTHNRSLQSIRESLG